MVCDYRKVIEEAVRVAQKRVIMTTFIPMIKEPDKNGHRVNSFGDYVVNINEKKFIDFIKPFGKISSGELKKDGKIEYWYWIIEK